MQFQPDFIFPMEHGRRLNMSQLWEGNLKQMTPVSCQFQLCWRAHTSCSEPSIAVLWLAPPQLGNAPNCSTARDLPVHPGFCSCTLPPMLFCLQASSCCKPKVTQPSQLSADGSLFPSLQCRVGAQPRSSWPPHGMESWRDFSFLRSRSSAKDRRKAVPAIYSGHIDLSEAV